MAIRHYVPIVIALAATPAFGWRGREHRALGAESYRAACGRLAKVKDRDPQTAQRYEVACGNLDAQSLMYGQGTAVSGDFTSEPSDLRTAMGAMTLPKLTNYFRLALTNHAHFQPLATREWRVFHQEAVAVALAASKKQGAAQLEGFEEAFYDSAFGDHFLQDSFAAGHMGFNRPGSSAGASKRFHDWWGREGRWVMNRRGAKWKTYGDGRLDIPANRDARAHVLAACTESVYGVLAAFVLGEFDPAADLAVWNEVAFTIEDRELLPDLETLFAGSETLDNPEFFPLLSVKRPAIKDRVIGAWSVFTMSFDNTDDMGGALLFGGDLLVPKIKTRAEIGAGVGFEGRPTHPRFAIDAGFVRGLSHTHQGLISHELDLGTFLLIDGGIDVTARLSYRLNIEAGEWMLRFDLGPAFNFDRSDFGFYSAIGISRVIGAAGGGGFFGR
jgi:hypothetical protein